MQIKEGKDYTCILRCHIFGIWSSKYYWNFHSERSVIKSHGTSLVRTSHWYLWVELDRAITLIIKPPINRDFYKKYYTPTKLLPVLIKALKCPNSAPYCENWKTEKIYLQLEMFWFAGYWFSIKKVASAICKHPFVLSFLPQRRVNSDTLPFPPLPSTER